MMRGEQIANAGTVPTLRDDAARLARRAHDADEHLRHAVRDIGRLLRSQPEAPEEAEPKGIGPQTIHECLSEFARALERIELTTETLKRIRDDLAPSTVDKSAFDRSVRERFTEKIGARGFDPETPTPSTDTSGRYG